MASAWDDKSLTPRQYLQTMGLSDLRFSDLELKIWFYEMRELWSKKSSLEILYDIKQRSYERNE